MTEVDDSPTSLLGRVGAGDWPGEVEAGDFRRSWRPVDLSTVLSGAWQPSEPTVGRRSDDHGLFYAGKVHTVSSESEGGKTWLAMSAVLDELGRANHVVYLDFEDDEGGIVGRLLTLGADRDVLAARFHYLRPEDPLGSGIHRDDLDELMRSCRPTLAVIDGITEALTLHGLEANSNGDVATFGRMLPRRLAMFGAASVSLDHVTKSAEGRGRYSIGAVHKLNGVDGAAYVLENRTPFGVGLTGRSTLRIAKDRPGQLRKSALPSSGGMFWAGDLVLHSHAEGFAEVEVSAPVESPSAGFRPTVYMGRIMDTITEHGPMSKRKLRGARLGKATNVDDALDRLIFEGYVSESSPHTQLKEWTDDDQA